MELSPGTIAVYVNHALDQMLAVADRVGEPGINRRPIDEDTNAIAALIIHCSGVAEFWLGHVALARPSTRQREEEFSATATLAELHEIVERTRTTVIDDVQRLDAGAGTDEGGRQFLPGGDASDAAVVLHVIEELYQHLGHMELAADALLRHAEPSRSDAE